MTSSSLVPEAAPSYLQPQVSGELSLSHISERTGLLTIQQLPPASASSLLHQIQENAALEQALAIWFEPLQPSTRYTLDVVAGPWLGRGDRDFAAPGGTAASLQAIYAAQDAIGVLAALNAYYAYEDSLTTLQRVQFTTSRYSTFSAQLANAANQLAAAPGATPIRIYTAATSPISWLETVSAQVNALEQSFQQYTKDRNSLATLVANFSPLADDLQPGIQPAQYGAAALVSLRATVAADWANFAQLFNGLYDVLVAALGHPEWVSNATPIRVPDTEISFFTDAGGNWVEAILLESPEPLPWQRIWKWITLTQGTATVQPLLPLWNSDGTRAVLIPPTLLVGIYNLSISFQGNLGAEAPCITQNGNAVAELVSVGAIRMGEFRRPILNVSPPESVLHFIKLFSGR